MASVPRNRLILRPALALLVFVGWSADTLAQVDYYAPLPEEPAPVLPLQLQADVIHTDNALRVPTDRISDTLAGIGMAGGYRQAGPELDVNVKSDLEWFTFQHNSFPNELAGFFDGSALWGKPTDPLQWVLREDYGQLQSEPLAATTPANLEKVNSVLTGPAVNLNFDAADRLTFFGLYDRTNSQLAELNAQRVEGGAQLAHAWSANTQASLVGTIDDVRFENPTEEPDYKVDTGFVRFQAIGARTNLSADAGYDRVVSTSAVGSGPLLRFNLDRHVSPTSTLSFGASQTYTSNTVSPSAAELGPASTGVVRGIAVADPFRMRGVSVTWRTSLTRTEFVVKAQWNDERYLLLTENNRSYWAVDGSIARYLQPDLLLCARARYESATYNTLSADEREREYVGSLVQGLGARLRAALRYERYQYLSSIAGTNFTENRIALRLVYPLAGPAMAGGCTLGM